MVLCLMNPLAILEKIFEVFFLLGEKSIYKRWDDFRLYMVYFIVVSGRFVSNYGG